MAGDDGRGLPAEDATRPRAGPLDLAPDLAPHVIQASTGLVVSDKGRRTAGLLQILLGGLGAGRFYLGYTKLGFLQILVTWGTCGAGVLWPIVDGIRMLEGKVPDAQGRPLRED
ncbi:MAG: TM2 domain-containing protein [Myxococcales bacterium]|nr:TM2 domain-containing protein [Myxococcales bacterium]